MSSFIAILFPLPLLLFIVACSFFPYTQWSAKVYEKNRRIFDRFRTVHNVNGHSKWDATIAEVMKLSVCGIVWNYICGNYATLTICLLFVDYSHCICVWELVVIAIVIRCLQSAIVSPAYAVTLVFSSLAAHATLLSLCARTHTHHSDLYDDFISLLNLLQLPLRYLWALVVLWVFVCNGTWH